MKKKISDDVQEMSVELGKVISKIISLASQSDQRRVYWSDLVGNFTSSDQDLIKGAVSVLFSLGLLRAGKRGNLYISSKHSGFALKSLGQFMEANKQIAPDPINSGEDRAYVNSLTLLFEKARKQKFRKVNPIHEVRVVNVIIKGIRNVGRETEDVFLHIFHKSWQQYHLAGIGQKETRESDLELAHRVMEEKLDIRSHQYHIVEGMKFDEIVFDGFSGSHGAITRYTVVGFALDSLEVDASKHIAELIDRYPSYSDYSFRWFSIDEMRKGISDNGEKIMESGARLLSSVNGSKIQNVSGIVDFMPKANSIPAVGANNETTQSFDFLKDLYRSNTIIWLRRVIAILVTGIIYLTGSVQLLPAISLFFIFLFLLELETILKYLNTPSQTRSSLADLAQILAAIIAFLLLLNAFGVFS